MSINLLDRFHQAVSFPEMVLALQTKSGAATLDYSCSDEMVTLDAADATRPMLGALLQTGGRKSRIVVSTLAEAAFYADAGWDDILYAG